MKMDLVSTEQVRMIGVARAEMIISLEMMTAKATIEEEGVAIEVAVAAVDVEAVIEMEITRADSNGTTTIGDNNMIHPTTIIDNPVRSLTTTRTLSQSFEIKVNWYEN